MAKGNKQFGKSGGGHSNLKTKLISSPMSAAMAPKKTASMAKGK